MKSFVECFRSMISTSKRRRSSVKALPYSII